jgi:hypothetical protein
MLFSFRPGWEHGWQQTRAEVLTLPGPRIGMFRSSIEILSVVLSGLVGHIYAGFSIFEPSGGWAWADITTISASALLIL